MVLGRALICHLFEFLHVDDKVAFAIQTRHSYSSLKKYLNHILKLHEVDVYWSELTILQDVFGSDANSRDYCPSLYSSTYAEDTTRSAARSSLLAAAQAFGSFSARVKPLQQVPTDLQAVASQRRTYSLLDEHRFQDLCGELCSRFQTVSREHAYAIAACPQHIGSNGEANPHWLEARKHRITGSVVGSIANLNPYLSATELLEELVWPSFSSNACTLYGNEHEDDVQAAFLSYCNSPLFSECHSGGSITNTGLCVSTVIGQGWAAMSPDGLLTLQKGQDRKCSALLEYKAPYNQRLKTQIDNENLYPVANLPAGYVQAGLEAPIPPQYFAQIQWGMGLLGLPRCFFTVWAPARTSDGNSIRLVSDKECVRIVATPYGLIQVTEIFFDSVFFEDLLQRASSFWKGRYVPSIVLKMEGVLEKGDALPHGDEESLGNVLQSCGRFSAHGV